MFTLGLLSQKADPDEKSLWYPLLMHTWLFCFCIMAFAEDPQPDDTQLYIQETQKILMQPELRKKEIANNPAATKADKVLQDLAGSPQMTEEIYALAASIFSNLAKNHSNDPKQMQEALDKAMSDPESFAGKLTPEQKKRLRELATQLEKHKTLP